MPLLQQPGQSCDEKRPYFHLTCQLMDVSANATDWHRSTIGVAVLFLQPHIATQMTQISLISDARTTDTRPVFRPEQAGAAAKPSSAGRAGRDQMEQPGTNSARLAANSADDDSNLKLQHVLLRRSNAAGMSLEGDGLGRKWHVEFAHFQVAE